MPKIDWKRPLRRSKASEHDIECRYVCHDGDRAIVAFKMKQQEVPCYSSVDESGYSGFAVHVVENVPLPKITKIRKLILWKDGSVGLRHADWVPDGWLDVIAVKDITITEGEGIDG